MIVLDCTNAKVSSGEAIHPNRLIKLDEMKRKRLNKKLVTSQTRLYVEKKICLW